MSIALDVILHTAINPALLMLPRAMDSDAARVEMLAIGQQESGFATRVQQGGPATGFWQNECGGIRCVLTNPVTTNQALALCRARKVYPVAEQVHAALVTDDVLAAGFARLFLWADPHPIPPVDADHEAAWQCYVRCWNPGKPRRETWDAFHAAARAQVMS